MSRVSGNKSYEVATLDIRATASGCDLYNHPCSINFKVSRATKGVQYTAGTIRQADIPLGQRKAMPEC